MVAKSDADDGSELLMEVDEKVGDGSEVEVESGGENDAEDDMNEFDGNEGKEMSVQTRLTNPALGRRA